MRWLQYKYNKKVEIRYAELVKQGYQPNLILVGRKLLDIFKIERIDM